MGRESKPKNRGGRPRHDFTREQMVEAAHLYYIENQNQKSIADQLRLTIRQASTVLQLAKSHKVVRFVVDPVVETEHARHIEHKFNLNRVIVVRDVADDQSDVLSRLWGDAAANYFMELWQEHQQRSPNRELHVALTGGQVFLEMVTALPDVRRDNLFVHVPALIGHGRLPQQSTHVNALAVASMLWARSGRLPGHIEYATVSPHPTNVQPGPEARKAVKQELEKLAANRAIREVLNAMNKLDVVFSRIGRINPDVSEDVRQRQTMDTYLKSVVTTKELQKEGAVGAFAYSLYDENGNDDERWRFFLTAGHGTPHSGVGFYQEMVLRDKTVVGIGNSLPAVRAGLRGKIFNVLITDQTTARAIAEDLRTNLRN